MFKKRMLWIRLLLDRHPWLPQAFTAAYIAFATLIVLLIVFFPELGREAKRLSHFVSFLLLFGPIVVAILQILNLRYTITSIPRLALLYLEIIVMFGVIYFWETSAPNASESFDHAPLIKGINPHWATMVVDGHSDKTETLRQAVLCFQDCLYFSLVTSTTVGYGDIVPSASITKFLVGVQVLVSFLLIAFGAGYTFSNSSQERGKAALDKIEARLEELDTKLKDLIDRQNPK